MMGNGRMAERLSYVLSGFVIGYLLSAYILSRAWIWNP